MITTKKTINEMVLRSTYKCPMAIQDARIMPDPGIYAIQQGHGEQQGSGPPLLPKKHKQTCWSRILR